MRKHVSYCLYLDHGVPQGTLFGPTLFQVVLWEKKLERIFFCFNCFEVCEKEKEQWCWFGAKTKNMFEDRKLNEYITSKFQTGDLTN